MEALYTLGYSFDTCFNNQRVMTQEKKRTNSHTECELKSPRSIDSMGASIPNLINVVLRIVDVEFTRWGDKTFILNYLF